MVDVHEVYRRELERMVVRCLMRGRRLHWVVVPHKMDCDDAVLIEEGTDGLATEMGFWYGVPLGVVSTRLTPPLGGPRHGTFVIEQCRIEVVSPVEVMTWRYPRSAADWKTLYLLTKTIVLDAAAWPTGVK